MKINVVTVRSGWILQKIAERICANAPDGVEMTLTHEPRRNENNFYVDVTNCYRGPMGGKDIGLFTHVHENNMQHVPDLWFLLDHIICMAEAHCMMFAYDPRILKYETQVTAKMPGEIPEGFRYKKDTVGIFQRGKYEGKGFHLMLELADKDIVKEFGWMFIGGDWDEVIDKLKSKTSAYGISDLSTNWPEDYKYYYDLVDYVLVPSKWEGGPMSLIEAAALGKRIISSPVGWAFNEIPVDYSFKNGDALSLASTLRRICDKRVKARQAVERLNYKDYAQYVVDKFEAIKK